MKFGVGDKVKVLRQSLPGELYWNSLMNKAIGKTYTVLSITPLGNIRLDATLDTLYNFCYPPKGLMKVSTKNPQLEFEFMS